MFNDDVTLTAFLTAYAKDDNGISVTFTSDVLPSLDIGQTANIKFY